jgi:ElaB/YqjD/DUF883 family membrane-anchored ribosome-binding protein
MGETMNLLRLVLAAFLVFAPSLAFSDEAQSAKEGFKEVHEGMKKVFKSIDKKAKKDWKVIHKRQKRDLKTVDKAAKKAWKKVEEDAR